MDIRTLPTKKGTPEITGQFPVHFGYAFDLQILHLPDKTANALRVGHVPAQSEKQVSSPQS